MTMKKPRRLLFFFLVCIAFYLACVARLGARVEVVESSGYTSNNNNKHGKTTAAAFWTQHGGASRTRAVILADTLSAQETRNAGSIQANSNVLLKRRANSLRIPNFLIAGTQKGGTTALATYLMDHGLVCHPRLQPGKPHTAKEAHFFDDFTLFQKGGLAYYSTQLFGDCFNSSSSIWMDGTPETMFFPERVNQLYQQDASLSSLKIMFILREPASRELSAYRHLYRETAERCGKVARKHIPGYARKLCRGNTILTFEQVMESEIVPSILRQQNHARPYGVYAKYLKRWFQLFDRRNIWVANYHVENLNSTEFLLKVHQFLELPPPVATPLLPRANHEKARHEILPSCAVQEKYYQIFQPFNEELYQILEQNMVGAPNVEMTPFPPFEFYCTQ